MDYLVPIALAINFVIIAILMLIYEPTEKRSMT